MNLKNSIFSLFLSLVSVGGNTTLNAQIPLPATPPHGTQVSGQVTEGEKVSRFADYEEGFSQDVLILQILLERLNLSSNCVDGHWGKKTEVALMTWQLLNGKEATGIPTGEILKELGNESDALVLYTVTEEDRSDLTAIPADWTARSKLSSMGYSTVQERLAEKGHASYRAVQQLNPSVSWPDPPAGTTVILPNCDSPRSIRRKKAEIIRISLSRRELTVFDKDGGLIALFPCTIARNKAKRPEGTLTVKNVAEKPTYLYDPKAYHAKNPDSSKLIIPPGPNNPVGMAWVGLSKQGYGIHGTPQPERIGEEASMGCFRLANWNAVKLSKMIRLGISILVEE